MFSACQSIDRTVYTKLMPGFTQHLHSTCLNKSYFLGQKHALMQVSNNSTKHVISVFDMSHQFGEATTADEVATFFANEIKGNNVLVTGGSFGGLGWSCKSDRQTISQTRHCRRKKTRGIERHLSKSRPRRHLQNLRPLGVLDLPLLKSVTKAGNEVNAYGEPTDVMITNAAVSLLHTRQPKTDLTRISAPTTLDHSYSPTSFYPASWSQTTAG